MRSRALIACLLGLAVAPAPAAARADSISPPLAPPTAGEFSDGPLPLPGGRGAALASVEAQLAEGSPFGGGQSPLTDSADAPPYAQQPFAQLAGVPPRYVDGVSDQNLPHWDGGFANMFAASWQRRGAIRLARYFVPWNVTSATGANPEYLSEYEQWYADAVEQLHLTPVLSLTQYGANPVPASAAQYRQLLEALLERKHVSYVEAWNEPNNRPWIAAARAAEYLREAQVVCERFACTPIAGDFLDSPNMASYERAYVQDLGALRPIDWGVHPYAAVKQQSAQGMYEFVEGLPGGGAGLSIWLTEAAAYECQPGDDAGDSSRQQGIDASWLVNRLMPALEPAHVFYYGFLGGDGRAVECPGRYEDTKLYSSLEHPRPAANFIFDDRGEPAAYTGAATAGPRGATLTGTVLPGAYANAEYRFEYGTGNSYDSTTPSALAGVGEAPVAVSATLTGLRPGATYHYRLVAFNREGSSGEGAAAGEGETFHT